MLLDSRERGREALANRMGQAAARPGPAARAAPQNQPPALPEFHFGDFLARPPVPEPPHPEPPRPAAQQLGFNDGGDFDWIDNPRVANLTHPFTREMISTLTCGYCNTRLNSINDLRYHLSNVRYHPVFSCCGRFFKRDADLKRHDGSKFGHNYQATRNA